MKRVPKPIVWPWTPEPEPLRDGETVMDRVARVVNRSWAPALKASLFDTHPFLWRLAHKPPHRFVRTARGFKVMPSKLPRFRGGKKIVVPMTWGSPV